MKECCKTNEFQEGGKKRLPHFLIVLGALAALIVGVVVGGQAFAQVEHGQSGQEPAMPTTYGAAVQAIDARLKNIDRLINTKKLDAVHAEAEVIREIAKGMAKLALKADSGVPKEAVKEINLTAKALADKFEAIDEAGDSGNLEATKKVYQEMVALQATLKKHVPESYQCPMKCEKEKTYSKPGECPVCGMDMKLLTSGNYSVEVKPAEPLQAGKVATILLTIKDSQGKPVRDLEKVHEKILHLFVVSKDLSWFSHEHPAMQADGAFKLAITFPAAGEYVLYHDFTPSAVGQQVVQFSITVPGKAAAPVPLVVDSAKTKQVEGYTFKFSTKAPLRAETEAEIIFEVSKDGKPITDMQPFLGSMGHLVIISQDLQSLVHSHPQGEGEEEEHGHDGKSEDDDEDGEHSAQPAAAVTGGPDIHFHAHFEAPGLYKGWGQFQHMGKLLTVPVVMEVKEADGAPGKEGGGHKH